jgi:threonine/homoserine/homoserine lactone efflux protein
MIFAAVIATDLTKTRPEPKSAHTIYMRALLVSLTNPKTLLFYGAFFPQFITMDHYIGTQIAILSVTFLAIAVLVDGGWALIAGHARGLLASRRWPRSLFFSAPLCRLP